MHASVLCTQRDIFNEKKMFLKRTTDSYWHNRAVQRAFIERKSNKYIHSIIGKGKVIPLQTRCGPEGG